VTNEEIERELSHLVTKAEFHKEMGDFKADLMKTIWLTQLTTIGLILIGVGLLIHFKL
jgi:hypothetical protein